MSAYKVGMGQFFEWLFSTKFMPHGHCYFWQPAILWLHVISDVVIALAYYSIPFFLLVLVRKRSDLLYKPVFILFAAFILLCGTTHVMDVVTTWKPVYWFEGLIKAATAVTSIVTAILLWPLLPKVLGLPSHADLRKTRRELEKEASQKAHFETSNQLKTQFLANVSHEIRTPLNGIIGMLDILTADSLNPQQKECADIALRSSQQLLSILNDVLDLSRIEAGKLNFHPQVVNIADTVGFAVSLLRPRAEQKALDLTLRVSEKVPDKLMTDPIRLSQIVNNLVYNAIKFTNEGSVTVDVDVGEEIEGDVLLTLKVTDTGVGIPPEHLQSIFDPFSQVPGHSGGGAGSGLGLTIVSSIARMMEGSITVDSEVGKGSTFLAQLRMQRPSQAAIADSTRKQLSEVKAEEWRSGKRKARLLIVEDHDVNRFVCERILQGFELHFATNGQEAIEVYQRVHPDLVFMDIRMPIMDGLEATKRIRSIESQLATHTPIVALTAYAQQQDEERIRNSGLDGIVTKPLDRRKLLAAVQRYLQQTSISAPLQ